MKVLIIAGPYEADRLRRTAVAAGFEAVAMEPGESLSGWVTASRPDLVVLAPKLVSPDPIVALAKIRAVAAGRVTTFLIGDAEDRARMTPLGDAFFERPVALADFVARARALAGRPPSSPSLPMAAPADDALPGEFTGSDSRGGRPPTLKPLVSQKQNRREAETVVIAPVTTAELLRDLQVRIDAHLEAALADAEHDAESVQRFEARPAPLRAAQDEDAASEFGAERSQTVEAPHDLVASMMAHEEGKAAGAEAAEPAMREREPVMHAAATVPEPPLGAAATDVPPAAAAAAEPVAEPEGPLHGTLGDEDVPRLLARLYRQRFSGRLRLRRSAAEKTVVFDAGFPVASTSNLAQDRMSDMLFREGKITTEQLARSGEIVTDTGRRMGAVLVDLGFLKMSELFPAVRRHFEEILYSLFAWDVGEWSIEPGPPVEGEKIRLSRHPAALIFEGIRRRSSVERLAPWVGGPRTVLAPAPRRPGEDLLHEAGLLAEERRIFALFDGVRTLAEVRGGAAAAEDAVYRVAAGLLALRLVVRTGVAGPLAASLAGRATAADLSIDRERILARFALVQEGDYFQILGVRRDASAREIASAYESLRRDLAPDRLGRDLELALGPELTAIRRVSDEGMRVLGDDRRRGLYRDNLRSA